MPNRALLVLAAAYVLAFASGGIQLPLTATAMSHVGLSMGAVGWMWATRSVCAILGPIMWGVLSDRRGDARPFTIIALLSGSALLATLSMTRSAPAAIIIFGLYGLLCAPSGSLIDGMVLTALGDAKHRFGRWRVWGTLGYGVTAFGSAILIDRGFIEPLPSVLFPVCAALTGLGGLALLFVPKLPRPALGSLRDVWPVIVRPDMIALFATSTLLWCSHIGYSSFITPLATSRGLPQWCVGYSIAAAIVVEAIMLREAGRITTRFGSRRVLMAVVALAVVRWLLTAITIEPTLFVALNALHGVTFGLFFGTLVQIVAERTPTEMRQATQGMIGSGSFGLGGALGALLVGHVFEATDAQTTWLLMAAVACVALVVAWRWVR
jgi:PPP family 3-phenylpropionic acid transporter